MQACVDVMSRDSLCLFNSSVLVVVEAGEPSAESNVLVGFDSKHAGDESHIVSGSCICCFCGLEVVYSMR